MYEVIELKETIPEVIELEETPERQVTRIDLKVSESMEDRMVERAVLRWQHFPQD